MFLESVYLNAIYKTSDYMKKNYINCTIAYAKALIMVANFVPDTINKPIPRYNIKLNTTNPLNEVVISLYNSYAIFKQLQ